MMRRRGLLPVVAALAAAACMSGDGLELDVGPAFDDPRFDRLRHRLAIEVAAGGDDDSYTGSASCDEESDRAKPCCNTEFCSARGLAAQVREGCSAAVSEQRDSTFCGTRVRQINSRICAAQRLLQIVESPAEWQVLAGEGGTVGAFSIGPQDAESNSQLALEALRLTGAAQKMAGDAIEQVTPGSTTLPFCDRSDFSRPAGTGPFAELTLGDELAHFYAESLQISEDASALLGRAGAAVSDAQLSRATDRSEAALLRNAPFASRAAAAHVLIGGAHGLPALTEDRVEGLFDRAPLSSGGQQALTLLRTLALDPGLLADESIAVEDLVVGGPGVPESAPERASIRYRLTRFFGESELATATASDIYARVGFDEDALSEARAWVAGEIRAFDRPVASSGLRRARVLPAERLADGTMSDFPLFAATRMPPEQPLAAYWGAIVRYDPTPVQTFSLSSWPFGPDSQGDLPPGATWGDETSAGGLASTNRESGRTYASIREDAVMRARRMIGVLSPAPSDPPELRDALLRMRSTISGPLPDGLGGGGGDGGDSAFRGRARMCGYGVPTDGPDWVYWLELDMSVEGVTSTAGFFVVLGQEGLDCAVRGTIDGVRCTASELEDYRATAITPFTMIGAGRFATIVEAAPGTGPAPDLSSYFVVRRDAAETGPLLPAQSHEITGFVMGEAPIGILECVGTPITPDLEEEVRDLISASTADPGRSAISCAGLPEDMLLPLENELTRDSFEEESSWRHYLESARRAATAADALGDDLVRLGLEMDLRAEAQADALENLCGVRLNPTAFARETPPRVTPPSGTTCAEGYELVPESGQCVLDPIAWAQHVGALRSEDVNRLEQCIGGDAAVDWVALGDQAVCMWQRGHDATTLCDAADPEHPCPVVARGAETIADCNDYLPDDATLNPIIVPADRALRLFAVPEIDRGSTGGGEMFPCEALARIRAGMVEEGDLEAVLGSGLLNRSTLTAYTRRLGWLPTAGDYSRVTYGDSTIASTGSPGGTGSLWPNGQTMGGFNVAMHLCPGLAWVNDPEANSSGIFCVNGVRPGSGDIAVRHARARTNDMLARAVLAARFMTGLSLEGSLRMPYFPRVDGVAQAPFLTDMDPREVATSFIEARSGSFWLDQPGDSGAEQEIVFDELGAHAEWIEDGIDWTRCPYEQSTCPADDVEYDTSSLVPEARGLPLIVRRVGDTRIRGAELAARAFFGQSESALMGASHLETYLRAVARGRDETELPNGHRSDLDAITTYFRRSLPVGYDSGHGCSGGCTCEQRPLACIAGYEDEFDVRATQPANVLHIEAPGGSLTPRDILNGLELTCMAGRMQAADPNFGCDEPPEINTMNDMLQADAFMRCSAENIEARAGATVVSNLPAAIFESIGDAGPGNLGTDSGEIAAQVHALRAAFEQLSNARHGLADNIRQMANLIRSLRAEVAQSEIAHEIEDLGLQSTVWNQVTSCVVAVAQIPSTDGATAAGNAIASAATCINSIAQISIASQISGLRHEALGEALLARFAQFDTEVNLRTGSMRDIASSIQTQLSTIDSALARISAIRTEGRRALARTLYLESEGADAHSAVSSVYRARYNTLLTRYTTAHDRALRSAFIARRAVEQRIAMPLETITDDLPTVEAPASWADEVCTMPSIDYEALRGTPGEDGEVPPPLGPEGFSGSYVGDYVDRLEQVVESYSFAFPFREGLDTAVISLRDDVFGVRAPCDTETPNLIYQAEHLDIIARDSEPGWERYGCAPLEVTPDPPAIAGAHCASARPLTPDEDSSYYEAPGGGADLGRPQGFRVRFGGSPAATLATSLVQWLTLPEGRYRLSWYGRQVAGSATTPDETVVAVAEGGARLDDSRRWSTALLNGWARYHTFVEVPSDQAIRVVLRPDWATPSESFVDLGGVSLVDVSSTLLGDVGWMVDDPATSMSVTLGELAGPGPFFATGATRTRSLSTCIDHTGEYFRSEAWTYGCTRVCPDGYDAVCDDRVASTRCYWQTSFPIDSSFVSSVLTGTPAGFAAGNYNYRIENIAVNVVGTGLRACDGSPSCYGSGNIAYSLLHAGPYPVRNARGERYEAPLFPGRIESARALAAERYVTNPISSADQSLLAGYQRPDFVGRPLGGTLLLRIWDEPTLAFDRLEDVQIVLGYRYWQRQR